MTISNNKVTGQLYFFHHSDEKPSIQMSDVHSEPNIRTGEFRNIDVTILNAREIAGGANIGREGFALSNFDTQVDDFFDDDQVERIYYPEIERFLKSKTKATQVHIFDHTIRVQDDVKRANKQVRTPVIAIHNDYTEWSGPKRVTDVMSDENASHYLKHHFTMVNVWRSIGVSAERLPLVMADARTMKQEDFVASDLVYNNRKGEIFQIRHREGQKWYFYPDMQRSEVILLKCFDNSKMATVRYTGHGTFENPTASTALAPRESIEVRTMISFAPPN